MTKFENGPAHGVTLMLRRAPMFLRVVEAPDGKIDALDQLDDSPANNERLFAYKLKESRGAIHINKGGGRGGFYTLADYSYIEKQPTDAEMRDAFAWPAWCAANATI